MSQGLSPQQLLAQQLQQLQTLEKLITTEKQVLQQHDPEALVTISQEKNQQLLAIESLDKHISLDQQFARDKAAGLLDNELAAITDLLSQCQQQNLVNGQIIQQSQLAVERMKTSLLENHTKNTITYDNKGKKSGGLSSIGIKA